MEQTAVRLSEDVAIMLEDASSLFSLRCDTAFHSLVLTLVLVSAREHLPSPRHRLPGLLFPALTRTDFLSPRMLGLGVRGHICALPATRASYSALQTS